MVVKRLLACACLMFGFGALVAYDPEFCMTDSAYCMRLLYDLNHVLLDLAGSRNLGAIDAVSTCIRNAEDYLEKPLAVYYWLNQRSTLGLPVEEGALAEADEAISLENASVRQIAEEWSTSAEGVKEVLDDWEMERDGAPFTIFNDIKCPLP